LVRKRRVLDRYGLRLGRRSLRRLVVVRSLIPWFRFRVVVGFAPVFGIVVRHMSIFLITAKRS
jgi:hypothetical protein